MGELKVERLLGSDLREKYISQLLGDLEAFEQGNGGFESHK